jgi:hypothetical protein
MTSAKKLFVSGLAILAVGFLVVTGASKTSKDGGAPLPTPPVLADGGAPLPTPPAVLDGGAPLPTPPAIA